MRIKKALERTFKFENDPDGGEITIEHVSDTEMQDIINDHTETMITQDTDGSPVTSIRQNRRKIAEETLLRVVTGWKNFKAEDDSELEFSNGNLLLARVKIQGFMPEVEKFRKQLADEVKALEKN